MKNDLHMDLLWREAAMLESVLLVDELDGDDGLGRIYGRGFADRGICALANGFAYEAERKVRGQRRDLTLISCQFSDPHMALMPAMTCDTMPVLALRFAMTYPGRRGRHYCERAVTIFSRR